MSAESWDPREVRALIKELWALRASMVSGREQLGPWLQDVDSAHRDSATNLAHYLAMRGTDLRKLQARLAMIGLSSLGRSETHVLANVDKVIGILHRIAGEPWSPLQQDEPAGFHQGPALLKRHAEALFGELPAARDVRIMVTLPSEAAHDVAMVRSLVAAGMDIARINCAHDGVANTGGDHRRRDGRPGRVRDAEQGPTYPGCDAHAGRHPAAHAGAPVEEPLDAARAEDLKGAGPCRQWRHAAETRRCQRARSRSGHLVGSLLAHRLQ